MANFFAFASETWQIKSMASTLFGVVDTPNGPVRSALVYSFLVDESTTRSICVRSDDHEACSQKTVSASQAALRCPSVSCCSRCAPYGKILDQQWSASHGADTNDLLQVSQFWNSVGFTGRDACKQLEVQVAGASPLNRPHITFPATRPARAPSHSTLHPPFPPPTLLPLVLPPPAVPSPTPALS